MSDLRILDFGSMIIGSMSAVALLVVASYIKPDLIPNLFATGSIVTIVVFCYATFIASKKKV